MGTDNIFHKRKARSKESLQRRKPHLKSYDTVLIVTEGSKTEPNYFRELINHFRLNNVRYVKIDIDDHNYGLAPINIVDRAIDKIDQYDNFFCVFDKDIHPTYKAAIDKAKRSRWKRKIKIIDSVPCFEFWILLHYEYTTAAFYSSGKGSICDNLIRRKLKKYLPEYTKGSENIAYETLHLLDNAVANAKKVQEHNKKSGVESPSTKVHILIEYMKTFIK